jgi:protein-S-isoprenylcysteine O-methyltransferase Ste14
MVSVISMAFRPSIHLPTFLRFDYEAAITKFIVSYIPYIISTCVAFMSTLDTFHALDLFPQIMPVEHTTTARAFNAQLIIGLVLTTAFSALRVIAFKNLGKFFTYQLSILPDHKLITHGLYSYIRHPSYTALVSVYVGVSLMVTAPGSTLYDYLGDKSTEKLVVVLALGIASLVVPWAVRRADVEDRVLRKEFGKEWEEWARVVRYKFVPGVL